MITLYNQHKMYTEMFKFKLIITNKKKSEMEIHLEVEFSLPLKKQKKNSCTTGLYSTMFYFSIRVK